MNRAVFLDRDGTILAHEAYLTDLAKVRLVADAGTSLRALREAGYLLVVVSNQSLVPRGLGTEEDVRAVSKRMEELLAEEGVYLDAIKYCFDPPEHPTARRKPKPGMILEAASELGVGLGESAMVGDDARDIDAGRSAGCGLNVLIGNAKQESDADAVVASLAEAAERVLAWRP